MATRTDPSWVQDKYFIKQKLLAISERYAIRDEGGQEILFVRRQARVLRNLAAALIVVFGLVVAVGLAIFTTVSLANNGPVSGLSLGAGIVVGLVLAGLVIALGIMVSPYRHIAICTDADYKNTVLSIRQENKINPIVQHFSLRAGGADGAVLARFRKNVLWNIIRRRWQILSPDGETVAMAMEDSIIMSLLRRTIGQYLPFFRTNFILVRADDRSLLGTFNRKFAIRDNYVLDLSTDRERDLDRRVALAIGVLLDTGEKR